MAPSTRLGNQAARRVNYSETTRTARVGSARNPIDLEDTPPVDAQPVRRAKTKQKTAVKSSRDSQGRFIKSDSSSKSKSGGTKVDKATPSPKKEKKVLPLKTECVICVTSKNTKRSFKAFSRVDTCEHFESICDLCIQKQIKTTISERQLAEAHLSCMFPECKAVLNHAALKKVLPKALYETWDTAVTRHSLSADPSYIVCLNPECGIYFSVEGCDKKHKIKVGKGKPKTKKEDSGNKATCPHCDYELCLSCNRPWHSGSCDSAKKREDEQSEQAIKGMGAKPCPKCGVNIDKQGGCNHMTCHCCRHHFCWECLANITHTDQHAETCSHRRPMIAEDVGNFVPEGLNQAQVNAVIQHAEEARAAGQPPPLVIDLPGGLQLVNRPAHPFPPPQPPFNNAHALPLLRAPPHPAEPVGNQLMQLLQGVQAFFAPQQ